MLTKWTKNDFEIKGRRTGSRLAGMENEYIYEIFWNGKALEDGYSTRRFTSKAKASQWLGRFIKMRNDAAKARGLI